MRKFLCLIGLTACSYTTDVYVVLNDADISDASVDSSSDASIDVSDAGQEATSPNAWVYNQANLSLKYKNCQRINPVSFYLELTYVFNASNYKSVFPFYICSNNLSDNCNVEQLIQANNSYYSNPAPTSLSGVSNALDTNCQLKVYSEPFSNTTGGVFTDYYETGYSPTQVLSDCDGGTVYMTMLQLYDNNFVVAVDKDAGSDTVISCY